MNKYTLYLDACQKALIEYQELRDQGKDKTSVVMKTVLYAVKAINNKGGRNPKTREELEAMTDFLSIIINLMSTLTPKEFITVFPIRKEYKGHKYGSMDYFHTRDYIRALKQDEPICMVTEILEFLFKYHNWEIRRFMTTHVCYVSDLRQLDGGASLFDELGIKSYSLQTDQKGNKFLLDPETGKTARAREKRHLKAVK